MLITQKLFVRCFLLHIASFSSKTMCSHPPYKFNNAASWEDKKLGGTNNEQVQINFSPSGPTGPSVMKGQWVRHLGTTRRLLERTAMWFFISAIVANNGLATLRERVPRRHRRREGLLFGGQLAVGVQHGGAFVNSCIDAPRDNKLPNLLLQTRDSGRKRRRHGGLAAAICTVTHTAVWLTVG